MQASSKACFFYLCSFIKDADIVREIVREIGIDAVSYGNN